MPITSANPFVFPSERDRRPFGFRSPECSAGEVKRAAAASKVWPSEGECGGSALPASIASSAMDSPRDLK